MGITSSLLLNLYTCFLNLWINNVSFLGYTRRDHIEPFFSCFLSSSIFLWHKHSIRDGGKKEYYFFLKYSYSIIIEYCMDDIQRWIPIHDAFLLVKTMASFIRSTGDKQRRLSWPVVNTSVYLKYTTHARWKNTSPVHHWYLWYANILL